MPIDCAFRNCSGLTRVNWNAENFTGAEHFSIFSGCTNLTTVIIGDNVKTIPSYAFSGCSGLTSITIPDSVTSIEGSAFSGCNKPTNIHISSIESWCKITGLDNLMGYVLSNKKLYINGEEITELIIPDSVTSIGESAFEGCSGLTSITIPDSVTSIGEDAFYGCTGLTSVTIGNSVTSIRNAAFRGCTGLTSITIPDSVTSIGDYAFYGCTGLTSITYKGTIVDWKNITKGYDWKYGVSSRCVIHCTDGDIKISD